MPDNTLIALLLSAIAGLATSIGAAATFVMRKDDFRMFALGMSFSAGVMIYISFMDVLPMAFEQVAADALAGKYFSSVKASKIFILLAFFSGVIFAALIDYFVPEHMEASDLPEDDKKPSAHARAHSHVDKKKSSLSKKTHRVGIMTALALALHNFPEGLSVFATGLNDLRVGIFVAIAIALHNIPEGVSVALPVYNATGSKLKAFWISSISGLAEPVGALTAYLFLMPYLNPTLIATILASTAGIMVYIALDELLPMAKEYGEEHYGIIGVFSGMGMMGLVSIFFA